MIPDLIISEFEEKEFNLESIGLNGFFLVLEEEKSYIYSDDGFYVEEIDKLFKLIDPNKEVFKITDEDNMELILNKEQFEIIVNILYI